MPLTKQAKDHLIAELADKLGLLELHRQVHRNTKALESMATQLEAKGLISVVKTFRRPGPDPELIKRVGQHLLSPASTTTGSRRRSSRRSTR